jgi:general secretion pathway protein D
MAQFRMIPRIARSLLVAAALSLVRAQPPATPPAAPAAGAAAAATPDDEILKELKLPDADIDSILSTLEYLTGRTILRPASLPTATYNIRITKPIPKSEAVLAIETVLALNGVGVSPQGDRFLVITPLTLTRTSTPEMLTGSAFDQPPSGKVAVKIFQLDFLRVQEFVQMVAGILNPQFGGASVQFPTANAVLITDSVANLQRVEALLGIIDKPSLGALKPKFYPLKFTKASDVVSKMRTILTPLAQQLGQATTYSADDGGAQIIVMTDPRQFPLFDDLIAKLDVKSNPFTKNDVIYLKHADAKEVVTLLTTIITGQNTAAQKANANALRPGQGISSVGGPIPQPVPGQPTPAPVMPAAVAAAADAVLGGTNEFSSLLTIAPDARSNAIVVSGTPDDLRLITNLVEKLDIVLAQVRLEVVIAEVSLSDNNTSGISQLGLIVAGDKLTGFSGAVPGAALTDGKVSRPTATVPVSSGFDLAATLAITTTPRKSNTSILSQPSITTTHNKEAKFFFGETRPIVSGVTSTPTAAGTTSGFSTSSQVQQQEIGTTITVKPLIGKDGSVQLDIKMDVSEVGDKVKVDNNDQYVIAKRTANSFTIANSGEIVVLGGMQRKRDGRSTSRLGPIPIIGDLLGSRSKEDQRTDLIFFLRPIVLTNTPADNAEAMKRVEGFEKDQRDGLKQRLDPNYVPAPKTFLEKVLR